MTENNLRPTIGLEVHAQLLTRTKMFCSCPSEYGASPNRNVCPVCLGLPGSLPMPNRDAVAMAIKLGIAVGAQIAQLTKFDRKNYFYPDLPKGYQISQYDVPLCTGGSLTIRGSFGEKRVNLVRIHLEEDAGKSVHDDPEASGTQLDFNRCGVPLVEIVSAPELASPEEAYAYLTEIRRLVRWLQICDGNMEEGSLRVDVNVSVASPHAPYGTQVEIKNLNSLHSVVKALEFEIARQSDLISQGKPILRQTLLWDEDRQQTRPMRTKERAHDYRYFPEPDLVPLYISAQWREEIASQIPELPHQRRERYIHSFNIKFSDADLLVSDRSISDFFQDLIEKEQVDVASAVRWVTGEALRWRKELGNGERFMVSCHATAQLIRLEQQGRVSTLAAKSVYEEMARTGREDPEAIIKERNLEQVRDHQLLEDVVLQVLRSSPNEVRRFREGDHRLKGYFIGQVMKATQGKADPKVTAEILEHLINTSFSSS
ncbi:MAG: Asp-tRNA(Asn)/Glu-tRNA(Gln) amidotransferase subunit GatB [bacterium]